MSSEAPTRPHRFRLTAGVLIGALLLAVSGLTVANARQGPRLVSAEINPRAAVARAGQRLTLRFDQSLDELAAPDLTIAPTVPVQMASQRTTLVVRFGDALRYATTYQITAQVRSTRTGATSTVTYSFRTPQAEVYLLQRAQPDDGADVADQIVRTVLGSTRRQVVRSEPRIQEYAVAEPAIAVVAQNSAEAGTLTIGPADGSGPTRVLADNSDISQLQSSGPGGLFGYVRTPLSGPDQNRALQLYDQVAGGDPTPVLGLDGLPIDPQDWAFVPGTTSVVAQTTDFSLFLIDPFNGAPVRPLGSHYTMHGFVPGTTTLIVEDGGRYTALNLAKGTTSTLPAFKLSSTDVLYRLIPLAGDHDYAGLIVGYIEPDFRYSIAAITNSTIRPLYTPQPASTRIDAVCPSPNDEYLAVETVPADAASDQYPFQPGFANTTTVFIDSATGQPVHQAAGFAVDWCN